MNCRDPHDVELMMFAQAASATTGTRSSARHGRWMAAAAQPLSLFKMIGRTPRPAQHAVRVQRQHRRGGRLPPRSASPGRRSGGTARPKQARVLHQVETHSH
ncbi:MAG: hypothetical protein U1F20_08940 [Lysobacterales bacterium]